MVQRSVTIHFCRQFFKLDPVEFEGSHKGVHALRGAFVRIRLARRERSKPETHPIPAEFAPDRARFGSGLSHIPATNPLLQRIGARALAGSLTWKRDYEKDRKACTDRSTSEGRRDHMRIGVRNGITDRFQLRRIQLDRAVDVSEANASAYHSSAASCNTC